MRDASEAAEADKRLWLEQGAGRIDLGATPQKRERANRKSSAPGRKQHQRLLADIGQLHADPVARFKSEIAEESRQTVHGTIGLPVAEAALRPKPERGAVWNIDNGGGVATLLRMPAQE
jgi:hypothetical protein